MSLKMGNVSPDATSYCRRERGSQDLEILFPLKEPFYHVVGQKDVLQSLSVIEHPDFWLVLYLEIRHRSYGEPGMWNL